MKKRSGVAINPAAYLEKCQKKFDVIGLKIAIRFLELTNLHLHTSPWGNIRTVAWEDTVALKELFYSEALNTRYGHFVDQRFIDYIGANFDDIDGMNWRKFEGLTGEFFARAGYYAVLGPSRNDNGVDVRIFGNKATTEGPPLVIIQCKRQKAKVDKVVVKGLYADIMYEKATSGLIVTTSDLAPGAEAVCKARGYPISTADRKILRGWVGAMRSF